MNIGIDLTSTPKDKSGVGRYLYNLVECLQKVDKVNNYFLFVQDDDVDGFNIYEKNFLVVPVCSGILRKKYLRLLWEQFVLPFKIKKFKIVLFHSPHYTIPYLGRVKKVVTFHDMTYFLLPEVHTFLKRKLMKVYITLSSKCADAFLTISNSTKADILNLLKIDDKKIYVTPMGVDQRFFVCKRDKNSLEKYGIDFEYLLYVGTLEPRKNILGVMKAYNDLPDDVKNKYRIVICGKRGWMYNELFEFIEKNNLNEKIHFTGFVDDNDLPTLYRYAKIFLYVSFYEGFGIPIIEAMASGTPCITSNVSSMAEVSGDACYKVSPYNTAEIKEAIINILDSEEMWTDLSEKGIKRAKGYTWESCAGLTIDCYNNTCNS